MKHNSKILLQEICNVKKEAQFPLNYLSINLIAIF